MKTRLLDAGLFVKIGPRRNLAGAGVDGQSEGAKDQAKVSVYLPKNLTNPIGILKGSGGY